MPLDGTNYAPETIVPVVSPIDRLIAELRGPERENWNFIVPHKCAMHDCRRLGFLPLNVVRDDEARQIIFAISDPLPFKKREAHLIRPRHVAASLEHYRDTGIALSPFAFVQKERGRGL